MKNYTIYNPETFEVTHVQAFAAKPANGTAKMVTQKWAKPMYNPQTDTLYNGANAAAQTLFERQAELTELYAKRWVNDEGITEVQTPEMLETRFPDAPIPFTVYAPNAGSGMKYEKSAPGTWSEFSATSSSTTNI